MKDRKLSALEMTVLGLFWQCGPCTTYRVMKELSSAASTYYKSRAGTTYSISKRLLKFGLIEVTDPAKDLIQTTAAGKEELRQWLLKPIPESDVAHSADLVRLRMYYFGIINPEERIRFIDNVLVQLREQLALVENLPIQSQKIGDYFGAVAAMAGVIEVRARIDGLLLVREFLANPLSEDVDWVKTMLEAFPWKGPGANAS